MDQNFKNLINKYHSIEWLFKSVERSRNTDRTDLNRRENLYGTTEFLVIMSDIALRISQNSTLTGRVPSHQDFIDFINLYINTQSGHHSKLIQEHGVLALSLMTYEQIKHTYNEINLLGRLFLLYKEYEKEIKEFTGLEFSDLLTILLAIRGQYMSQDHYVFGKDDITYEKIKGLKRESINKFLDYFSINIRDYRTTLRDLNIDKNQLYSFRLIERYPVINFDEEKYIVPSVENLLHSVTTHLHIHLLEFFAKLGKGSKYHTDLGKKLENYVETLTKEVFSTVTPAIELVPKKTLNAEFAISHNDTAIVVEVKKFAFNRDTAFQHDLDNLDRLLERHFVKAFEQIETTFKHLKESNKIGIIVTFGHLHMQAMLYQYMRENHSKEGVEYLENIVIMSVGSYEALLSNSPDDILEILNDYLGTGVGQRGDVIQAIHKLGKETKNPLLEQQFSYAFDSLDLKKFREGME